MALQGRWRRRARADTPSTRLAALRDRLLASDLELFRAVTRGHTPALDAALPRLSKAANHSRLWIGIAAVTALGGRRRERRAALRGLVGVGLASAIVNQPAKRLVRRQRPLLDDVPLVRRLARVPASKSFPSGHAASAFAFATGMTLERPAFAPVVFPLAGAVAFSRVYTGVHYPSDVVVGATIGIGCALVTRKPWPVPSWTPAQAKRTRTQRAPSEDGAGLVIAVNPTAGQPGFVSLPDRLREALPEARVIELEDPQHIEGVLAGAAHGAAALGIAGGDGSVNAAANVARKAGRPLAVVPGGTFNNFAHEIGIDSVDAAIDAVRAGQAVEVDVAMVADRPFLNVASLGAYAELVHAREQLEDRIGKWPALVVALIRVLRHSRPVDVEIDGERMRVWMAFFGNCRYQPPGFGPTWRERLDDGTIDVRLIDGTPPLSRSRLVFAVLTGRLARSRVYRQWSATRVRIRSFDGPLRLVRDGEAFDSPEAFVIRKDNESLAVYAPG